MLPSIQFANPEALFVLLVLPLVGWYLRPKERYTALPVPTLAFEKKHLIATNRTRFFPALKWLKILAFIALVIALARPQILLTEEKINSKGIDIVLALDVSASMLSKDFEPDRLSVSKKMAIEFVKNRRFDRIGIAAFAAESFVKCPLTTDYPIVTQFLDELEVGKLHDGTAIGLGLMSAAKTLTESKAKSKVIILLTDGENNSGDIQPLVAAEVAKTFNIKVYTIGVGSTGEVFTPFTRKPDGTYQFGWDILRLDENLLSQIAEMTGGRYFRATDEDKLNQIYQEIDQLEKTKTETYIFKRRKEAFFPFALVAFVLLALEIFLQNTIFRTLP